MRAELGRGLGLRARATLKRPQAEPSAQLRPRLPQATTADGANSSVWVSSKAPLSITAHHPLPFPHSSVWFLTRRPAKTEGMQGTGDSAPAEGAQNLPTFLRRGGQVQIDCNVQLPEFEGPMDLLLHLIKSQELDILNLPIARITSQYLVYLDYMREMNLDLASEYLVMAATLTYLKSQVILPQEETTEATGQDPRAQLIRRLIELKCYKELASSLASRPRLFRESFLCRNTGADEITEGLDPEVALTNPFQLVDSYRQLLDRRKTITHNVYVDEVPISVCIGRIADVLKGQDRISFQQLLPEVSRPQDVISMFLGVLEMARLQMTGIEQDKIFGPIDVVRRVEPADLDEAKRQHGLSWA